MRLRLEELTKRYGSLAALEDVTAEIAPGQIVTVLGANGAGKTTLLRCLATVAAPTSGRILADGEPLLRSRLDIRRRMFFLPDLPLFHPGTTPVRHIAMVCRLYGIDDSGLAGRIMELLDGLDLLGCARGRVENLSRGQAYKTAMAALLAVRPEVVLLDEPFASGIDPHAIATLKRRLRELSASGTAVLYTTQILEIAESFSDSVAILDRSRLHAFGPVATLNGRSEDGTVLPALLEALREKAP